jgi:predicted RNase H-like nuclease
LLSDRTGAWECVALAPSYDSFINLADGVPVNWGARHIGSKPNPSGLIEASKELLGGRRVNIVTVDMPVSTVAIVGRRGADEAISDEFGDAGCSTHSPNAFRPGLISQTFSDAFAVSGFPLATTTTHAPTAPRLVEVYPHPALLKLTGCDYRRPYKCQKTTKYWPNADLAQRKVKLLEEYATILTCLQVHIQGIPLILPAPAPNLTFASMKRYEDGLDALVCGWVGIKYLAGNIQPHGDDTAAIWTP